MNKEIELAKIQRMLAKKERELAKKEQERAKILRIKLKQNIKKIIEKNKNFSINIRLFNDILDFC